MTRTLAAELRAALACRCGCGCRWLVKVGRICVQCSKGSHRREHA